MDGRGSSRKCLPLSGEVIYILSYTGFTIIFLVFRLSITSVLSTKPNPITQYLPKMDSYHRQNVSTPYLLIIVIGYP